ncbi:hypothetical protein Ana3638_06755 [Anaerocolumna sedimenticola]|uniref:Uncharacterized protein n=1 Tax=Anaerocolumna sedimenticola TaxID=2696063 RepID=A0A6P1TLH6_9FIRM|nr:hypothetical protein [Anaerocolumna sedimenticola]QHQ60505.1 hypothetical protein Ana3638_06755 [Anaerocolumna sedimenticola]
MLIVIGILLFFYLLIQYSNIRTKQIIQKEKETFWNKEYQANSTRKSDISGLDYITIPMDTLPFTDTDEGELNEIQSNIKSLFQKPILNLAGLSNTDLKLKYGVANIKFLIKCDDNYTFLVKNLSRWGSYLYDHNRWNEAVTVLEFGVQCKTDISKNYILLAELYKELNTQDKIDDLIQTAQTLDTLSRENILISLKEIKMSFYLK